MKKIGQNYISKTIVLFLCFGCATASFSQNNSKVDSDLTFNTSDFINDINQEMNDHKPYGEHHYYVISGVFKELSNARAFVGKYRSVSTNDVFIFKEDGEKYYVCPAGPLKLEDAKKLVEKLNNQDNTQSLSEGKVWILTK